MEANNVSRAPVDARPLGVGQVGSDSSGLQQLPARPTLFRSDSRSSIAPPLLRGAPSQPQPRPQFQPGGQVSAPQQQFAPRPSTPLPRPPLQAVPPGPQLIRTQPPTPRPSGPQSFAPQQVARPLQPPTAGQPPLQRAPPPNNLQFGPRQPPQFGSPSTPDGSRPQVPIQSNGAPRNGTPYIGTGQISRQSSQGSIRGNDSPFPNQNKSANLDNPTVPNIQNVEKPENGVEMLGASKGRSYSISASPGAPSLFKQDDDRRKSVSAIGGKIDDFSSRAPGLGFIQEGKLESKENVRGSKESIRSEASNEGLPDRSDTRIFGSKMSESFISSQPISAPRKKIDDDDDVILQSNLTTRNAYEGYKNTTKVESTDRSPSLSQSDESPEPRQRPPQTQPLYPTKPIHNISPEPPRPKTEIKPEQIKQANTVLPNITNVPRSPLPDTKPPLPVIRKPNELNMTASDKHTPRKISSAPKARAKDGDNDSGVDESTQGNDLNGSPGSPNKRMSSKLPTKEKSSSSIKMSLSRSSSKSATAKTPENPLPIEKKKVPMNKIQVGNAASPNIKAVKSKIGSLANTTYKPGGGNVKIENRKLDFNKVTPKIAAKNDAYAPSGGAKKIPTTKLEWNAKSKIGSLQNTAYKPGGGDKKIETVKLDFKEKAKPKVASTVNITHKPGGGAVKIENQKLEFKAQSKVGSMDNVKHKPGGGEIKIFDDKEYIKQIAGQTPIKGSQNPSRQEEHYYSSASEWYEEERPMSRCRSARAPRTPRAISPRRRLPSNYEEEDDRIQRNNERNRRASMARPASARDPPRSACARGLPLNQRPAFSIY